MCATPSTIFALKRDAIVADIKARRFDHPTRFTEERDDTLATLAQFGVTDFDPSQYDYPGDLEA
jgi:hypothetical protein